MDLLVMGGTHFVGRAVVAEALDRGHSVTTLTRGVSGPPLPGARAVHADRNDREQVERALDGLSPEAVIDTSGRSVVGARIAADLLADVASYAYVSSLNAYRGWPESAISGEDDPVWPEDADLDDYGAMKAESERILQRSLGHERVLAARAGLIIGPHDNVGRLPWWLQRIGAGGRVPVPDAFDQPMAFVDVRDLAGWLVTAVEQRLSGPVNATGPFGMTTFGDLLATARQVVAATGCTPAELVPIGEERLEAAGVQPWVHLPFWLPRHLAVTAWQVDTSTARSMGLPTRPIEDSLAATWAWLRQEGNALRKPEDGGPGLPPELERELLAGLAV